MVCISVAVTVIVIEIGFKTTNMPHWVEAVVIEKLGKIVFVDNCSAPTNMAKTNTESECIVNKAATTVVNGSEQKIVDNMEPPGCVNTGMGIHKYDNKCVDEVDNVSFEKSQINETLQLLRHDINCRSEKEMSVEKWRLVSVIVDRLLMLIFAVYTLVVTVTMMSFILVKSRDDFELARLENE